MCLPFLALRNLSNENNLINQLPIEIVDDILSSAKSYLETPLSLRVLLDAILYYVENDAFLPEIGYKGKSPAPYKTWQLRTDRKFYYLLGTESKESKCAKEDCPRGAILVSKYCRTHQFEMIMRRPCPYDD